MIWALVLLGVVQSAQPNLEARSRSSLSIPAEIAPAVIPYLQCMVRDEGQRIIGASTGAAARAGIQLLLGDCRQVRVDAEARAREMLRSTRYPAGDRERIISATLSSIDRSRDDVADHLDRVNARFNATQEQDNASN